MPSSTKSPRTAPDAALIRSARAIVIDSSWRRRNGSAGWAEMHCCGSILRWPRARLQTSSRFTTGRRRWNQKRERSRSRASRYGYCAPKPASIDWSRISPYDANARRIPLRAAFSVFRVDDTSNNLIPRCADRTRSAPRRRRQHVNKTDSAGRFTHLPTISCGPVRDERSQHKKTALRAMRFCARACLNSSIARKKKSSTIQQGYKKISRGEAQSAHDVLQPYQGEGSSHASNRNTGGVLDGAIDEFISLPDGCGAKATPPRSELATSIRFRRREPFSARFACFERPIDQSLSYERADSMRHPHRARNDST